MSEPGLHNYVLRSGEPAAVRLRLLADVVGPTTESFLDRLCLQNGMHCLDVGCGIGAVTVPIAERVSPRGATLGIDLDAASLEFGRIETLVRGLNVEFRTENILTFVADDPFDFVYGRFLLTHLPDPRLGLQRMRDAALPGGLIAVEDIDFTGHFCYPACPGFDSYVMLYQEVVRRKRADPNIGPRLFSLFLDVGLENVEFSMVQPVFHQGPGKRIAQVTLEHIREAVVSASLASDQEIDTALAEVDQFASDPKTIMSLPRIFQVWGRRPQ